MLATLHPNDRRCLAQQAQRPPLMGVRYGQVKIGTLNTVYDARGMPTATEVVEIKSSNRSGMWLCLAFLVIVAVVAGVGIAFLPNMGGPPPPSPPPPGGGGSQTTLMSPPPPAASPLPKPPMSPMPPSLPKPPAAPAPISPPNSETYVAPVCYDSGGNSRTLVSRCDLVDAANCDSSMEVAYIDMNPTTTSNNNLYRKCTTDGTNTAVFTYTEGGAQVAEYRFNGQTSQACYRPHAMTSMQASQIGGGACTAYWSKSTTDSTTHTNLPCNQIMTSTQVEPIPDMVLLSNVRTKLASNYDITTCSQVHMFLPLLDRNNHKKVSELCAMSFEVVNNQVLRCNYDVNTHLCTAPNELSVNTCANTLPYDQEIRGGTLDRAIPITGCEHIVLHHVNDNEFAYSDKVLVCDQHYNHKKELCVWAGLYDNNNRARCSPSHLTVAKGRSFKS